MDPSAKSPETYNLAVLDGLLGMGSALDPEGDAEAPFTANFTIPRADIDELDFFPRTYLNPAESWRNIDGDWLGSAATFALLLDRAVNNSSLALAIELEPGGDVLLFAADAQVGNWLSWLELTWDLGVERITGPDLIARTILYKVGHHASLNASLKEHGVEKMDRLEVALVPVDKQSAIDKKWGHNIPFPDLIAALRRRATRGTFLSDEDADGARVIRTNLYYEAHF